MPNLIFWVVTKGSGDEGKWCWRELVTMGGEVVMKGSGDDGKWWGREVVTKGSGDDGKWWRRKVVTWGNGDEGKAGVVSVANVFLLCVLQRVVVPVCVVLFVSWRCGGRSHWNCCMNVAWAMFWGGSRSTKPCVFPCKMAAGGPAMKGTSCVRRVRLGSFRTRLVPSMCFLKLWWQIALKLLH